VDMERAEGGRKTATPAKADEVRRIPELKDDAKVQSTRL
jgi:hypothetical protein